MGITPAPTVLDLIHFSALAIIIATTTFLDFGRYLVEAGVPIRRIRRLDYAAFSTIGLTFVVTNLVLVRSAMIAG